MFFNKLKMFKTRSVVYVVSFMDLFGVGLTIPVLTYHLRELGASHFTIGLISSLYAGVQIISKPVVSNWNRKSVLQITSLLCSLGHLGLGITNSVLVIALVRILLGFTKHTQSTCVGLITDLVPPSDCAKALNCLRTLGSLGLTFGPILAGYLYELKDGFFNVCLVTSIVFIINTALMFVIRKPEKGQNRQNDPIWSDLSKIAKIDWRVFWDVFLLRFICNFGVTMYYFPQCLYLKEKFEVSQRYIGYTISIFSATRIVSSFLTPYINNYFYKNDEFCLKRMTHFLLLITTSSVPLYKSSNIEMFWLYTIPFSMGCTLVNTSINRINGEESWGST